MNMVFVFCMLLYLTTPSYSFRPDILKSEVIIPKMDSSVMQVTIPTCPNRSSTSPSRSRRVKTRHRKPGKGSSGDLAGLKSTQSSPNGDASFQANSSTTGPPKQLLEPSAALRGLSHEQQQRQLSSSSPDLICTTLEAEGQGKGEPTAVGLERGGSLSASAGLGGSEAGAAGLDDLTETPPRSDTPSEDAASFPFSSSPDSPCGRGAAAGRGSLGSPRLSHDGEDKEEGAGAVRLPRGASGGIGSQHLTPSAILYRAAITRKQVQFRRRPVLHFTMLSSKSLGCFYLCYFSVSDYRGVECHQKRRRGKLTVRSSCHGDGESLSFSIEIYSLMQSKKKTPISPLWLFIMIRRLVGLFK